MVFLRNAILLSLLLYGLALGAVYAFQRSLIYFPIASCPTGEPSVMPDDLQEVTVNSPALDGTDAKLSLKGWYRPAREGKPTLLFMHGNADGLLASLVMTRPYISAGYGVMLVGYRGYNCQLGNPTEAGLYADARAFIQKLQAAGIGAHQLVLMGYSLGTGVATQMAQEYPALGLILVAPFLSLEAMTKVRFPIFPSKIVWDKFDNAAKIPGLKMPLLVTHGDADTTVPFAQGKQLAALAGEDLAQFIPVGGANHVQLFTPEFYQASMRWIADLPFRRQELTTYDPVYGE